MLQSRFYQNQAQAHVNQVNRPFASPYQTQAYNPATAWNAPPLQPQMHPLYFHASSEPVYNHPLNAQQQQHYSPQAWQAPEGSPFVYFGENDHQPQQPKQSKQDKTTKEQTAVYNFLERFKKNWTIEELNFSMNKISMAGLIFGLMFLGSLFFLIGFLVAVNLYDHKPDPVCIPPKIYMPTQGAVISGQTGSTVPMSAPMPHTPRMAQPHSGLGMQGGRMPTSMQHAQPIPYQGQGRIPSFQMR